MSKYIVIDYDKSPESPRNWDNLGTMACFSERYSLGDEDHGVYREDKFDKERNRWIRIPMLDEVPVSDKDFIVLPLYLYDHSGITMNTTGFSCPWDSGQVGIIFVSKEKVRKEYGWKVITQKRKELIESYLRSEVKVYDQYITGSVYCFKCIENGVETDSCYGFYGDDIEKNGMVDNIGKEFYEGATVIRAYLGEKVPEDIEAA